MTTKPKTNARLTAELLEMAKGMHAGGIMDDAGYDKITMAASVVRYRLQPPRR